MKAYLFNLLISLDQMANTIFAGNPDETISSRMGKAIRENRCVMCHWVCWLIGLVDKNHCRDSIEDDEA
jgi:hypothetical protein